MTALREHLAVSITAVEAEIARLSPLVSATVTPIYRRGHTGKWSVTARLEGEGYPVSIPAPHATTRIVALSPQFEAWDDAVSFRLAVLEALDRAT